MQSLTIVLPDASGQLVNTGGCLVFHASEETSGSAAAHYRLWDGTDTSGALIVPVSLSADQSTRDFFPAHIAMFRTGLYYELVDGAVEGAVGVRVDHNCDKVENAIMVLALNGYPE